MKKILMTSLFVFGLATVASASSTITGGSSTSIGNADFNASNKVTLEVEATVTAFAVAGKHLNSGTTYGLTSENPIMRKNDQDYDKGDELSGAITDAETLANDGNYEM